MGICSFIINNITTQLVDVTKIIGTAIINSHCIYGYTASVKE